MADFVPNHRVGDYITYRVGRHILTSKVTDISPVQDDGDTTTYTLTLSRPSVTDVSDEY